MHNVAPQKRAHAAQSRKYIALSEPNIVQFQDETSKMHHELHDLYMKMRATTINAWSHTGVSLHII
jgi:hypothetical protein